MSIISVTWSCGSSLPPCGQTPIVAPASLVDDSLWGVAMGMSGCDWSLTRPLTQACDAMVLILGDIKAAVLKCPCCDSLGTWRGGHIFPWKSQYYLA